MAYNQAAIGKRPLIFSLEMKTFKLFSRIHSARAKVPGYKIRPNMSDIYGKEIRERLRSTGAELAALPIGFVDSVKDMETIRRISKIAVREYGVDEIIIDYLGLAIPKKGWRGSPYERARLNSELGKELAMEISRPVVALSQLRRKYKEEKGAANTAKGNEVEPELDMLKNAGDIENDADGVIFLWGEKEEEGEKKPISDIKGKVDKQRNGELFPFELKFAKDIFHFTSLKKMELDRAKLLAAKF
jgi:replicative DNA helicase